MKTRSFRLLVLFLVASMLLPALAGAETNIDATDSQGAERAGISIAPQTGKVRFMRLTDAQAGKLARQAGAAGASEAHANVFWREYGALFGVQDAGSELALVESRTDYLGTTHLNYNQVYRGVPVFAGVLRLHFDAQGLISAANGTFIPDINLDTSPSLSAAEATYVAIADVNSPGAVARSSTLYVYRQNLARGIPGANHLVYEVEVSNGLDVREFIYVDAHDGAVVDRITGIYDNLDRKVYNQFFEPAALIWQENDELPFTDPSGLLSAEVIVDVNRVINYAEDTYDMVKYASGGTFLSYDGNDATMHSVVDSALIDCPNAQWNGAFTHYCVAVTGDDTVAHEWGHAYTDYTHNLIYAWQPGALNESYSDIFGEVVDLINGEGLDDPGGPRTEGACSLYTVPPPLLRVTAPESIAGDYAAGAAQFGPTIDGTLAGSLMIADDGSAAPTEACNPLVNDLSGHIALIRRGTCDFVLKVKNAQDAGALGVVIANHEDGGDSTITMAGDDPSITIQSLFVGYSDGNLIEAEINGGAQVDVLFALDTGVLQPDDSYRWLSGEDDPGFGGAIRDMWTPTCYGDPDKVTSEDYMCGYDDNGGVHYNCGVPNHAFALLVDGGNFNGQEINGIGLTKAFHIYWRAQSVFQVPTTDFADHADALEAACGELVGTDLADLTNGEPSGQVLTTSDCGELATALLAVEMRVSPDQCGYEPLLAPDPPPVCLQPTAPFYSESFDNDPGASWQLSNEGVYGEYIPRDWMWLADMPAGQTGGFFAEDALNLGDCTPGSDDQSGVVYLDSPLLTVPDGDPIDQTTFVFEHYLATEPDYDGGNLWISVNGGQWRAIKEADFFFNPYNGTLETAANGNTNPLAGQDAFHGSDGGVVTGSWGQSQIDLSAYAKPGDQIQLRFALGTDGCTGIDGWYLDNVEAYLCEVPPPTYNHQHQINQQKPN